MKHACCLVFIAMFYWRLLSEGGVVSFFISLVVIYAPLRSQQEKLMKLTQSFTLTLIAALSCFLSGCATTPQDLVGHVGCPASQITISHYKRGFDKDTYQASCGKQRYYCSTTTSSDTPTVACAKSQTS